MKGHLALVSASIVVALVPMSPVTATFRGEPGLIAYIYGDNLEGRGELRTISSAGGKARVLLDGRVAAPSWSPDGRRLMITRKRRIDVLDPSGRRLFVAARDRAKGGTYFDVYDATWFPDGARIAYLEDSLLGQDRDAVRTRVKLVVARLRGERLRRLGLDPEYWYDLPSVSPDGRWIVVGRAPFSNGTRREILSIHLRTGRKRVLTPELHRQLRLTDWSSAFASDGSIVLIRRQGQCFPYPIPPGCDIDVLSIEPTGEAQRVLIDGPPDVDQDGHHNGLSYVIASPDMSRLVLRVDAGVCRDSSCQSALYAFDLEERSWAQLGQPEPAPKAPPDGAQEGEPWMALLPMEWQPDCTIYGTRGDDVLNGTAGPDLICALAGDDVVRGLGGDDSIFGHGGDDRIVGGGGADIVVGNAGRDRCERDRTDYSRVC